jgi:hypothetical protein
METVTVAKPIALHVFLISNVLLVALVHFYKQMVAVKHFHQIVSALILQLFPQMLALVKDVRMDIYS